MSLGPQFGAPSCMAHPDTYINKVLIGSSSKAGQLQLWNFATQQLLHTFEGWWVDCLGRWS